MSILKNVKNAKIVVVVTDFVLLYLKKKMVKFRLMNIFAVDVNGALINV